MTADSKRPLSPHLQVYRLPYNALMSIIGRATGIGLFKGLSLFLIWFIASVWNPAVYETTMMLFNTPVMDVALRYFGLLTAFVIFFYLGNGVRHVLWDMVIGVNEKAGILSGNMTLFVSALLTLILGVLTL